MIGISVLAVCLLISYLRKRFFPKSRVKTLEDRVFNYPIGDNTDENTDENDDEEFSDVSVEEHDESSNDIIEEPDKNVSDDIEEFPVNNRSRYSRGNRRRAVTNGR